MKNHILLFAFTLCAGVSFGQSLPDQQIKHMQDSIKASYLDNLAWKNPLVRQAGVSTDVFASGDIESDLYGKPFFKGEYRTVRTNAFFNAPIWQKGKNRISAGISASHQTMELDKVVNYEPSLPVGKTQIHNTLLGGSLTFTRVDSLFNRPIIYSVTGSALVDPTTGQRRFSGTGLATLTLRKTESSTFSIGLIGLIDPSLPIPLIPFISYSHRFKSGLQFTLDPSALALRKEFGSRSSLSLSNSLGGNLSLYKRDIVNLPIEHAFSTLEMKSGLVYERLMSRKMVLTLSGGVRSTFTSKVLEGQSNSDEFIKNTQRPVPYLRVGVSFLPFWKGLSN